MPDAGEVYAPPQRAQLWRDYRRLVGLPATLLAPLEYAARLAAGYPQARRGRGTFELDGVRHRYAIHPANRTWTNERSVELPIALHALRHARGGSVLEVGNVLGHYGARGHLVVDKYEAGPGVVNADVLDVEDPAGFDLILSISTIEHVGWDEQPRAPERALRAIEHLAGLLRPGGELLVTLPVGYNPHLDRQLAAGDLGPGAELLALRRQGRATRWRQVPPEDVWDAPYLPLFFGATGVVVVRMRGRA